MLRIAVGGPPVEVAHLASLLREVVLQHLQGEPGGLIPSSSGNTSGALIKLSTRFSLQ